MNWDVIAGQWNQVKGHARAQWGKLTDDDLTVVAGRRDELAGRIQELYGIQKSEAEHQINTWLRRMRTSLSATPEEDKTA